MKKNSELSDAFSNWAKEHAYPMKTLEAGQGVEDLEGLRAIVGDARVVALGESNHFIGEITQAKHRIVEFLMTEMGFNAIALEAGFADSLIIDEYVQGGPATPEMWYRGGSLGMALYPEMQAMGKWMRAYNLDPSHTRKLHFHGSDFLGGNGTWMPALDRVIAYFEKVEPAYAGKIKQTLLPLVRKFERPLASVKDFSDDKHPVFESQAAYDVLPKEEKFALTAYITGLIDRLELLADVYKKTSSAEDYDLAHQLAISLRQADRYKMNRNVGKSSKAFWKSMDGAATFGIRARTMAENTLWLRKRYGKVILMLHNNHLRRTLDNENDYNTGHQLQNALKDDYVTIGCTYGYGPWYLDAKGKVYPKSVKMPKPGSLDAGMLNTGLPMFYLNLHEAPKSGPVYDWLSQPRPAQVTGEYSDYPNTLKIWDGLYFVREIHVTGRQH
ncbi:MAG: erythromycin esterase family protein [Deltaproteobacteria bacterium]|nr:erythromycin esterase family protein [Deltaproteobacteria bacterium]